jgi:hypothetical protein
LQTGGPLEAAPGNRSPSAGAAAMGAGPGATGLAGIAGFGVGPNTRCAGESAVHAAATMSKDTQMPLRVCRRERRHSSKGMSTRSDPLGYPSHAQAGLSIGRRVLRTMGQATSCHQSEYYVS